MMSDKEYVDCARVALRRGMSMARRKWELMEAMRPLARATHGCAHGVIAGWIGIVDGKKDPVTCRTILSKE